MNYIEEMMKIAEVKQEQIACQRIERNLPQCAKNECWDCGYSKFELPEFSAEKQLEIIKLISEVKTYLGIKVELGIYYENNFWGIELWREYGYTVIGFNEPIFNQALARLTTNLMKLGTLDKAKVKEILENAR